MGSECVQGPGQRRVHTGCGINKPQTDTRGEKQPKAEAQRHRDRKDRREIHRGRERDKKERLETEGTKEEN